MGHLDPIAYTYDADHHCPDCAIERFGLDEYGLGIGARWPRESATDSEGNELGAVAPWDEWWSSAAECDTLSCSDCGRIIDNAHRDACTFQNGSEPCTIREEYRV